MHFSVVTLFPEMFQPLDFGITGRALKRQLISIDYWNPRDYTSDPYKTVDDRPYGGGPGMVMKYEPLALTLQAAKKASHKPTTIYLSPQGKPLTQAILASLSQKDSLILLAGRYEGVDERLVEQEIDAEYSLGDYILSGGELAAMVLIDGITRLLPEALGDKLSAQQDSFSEGLLDCPHYTRPESINGQNVPSVLLGGDHTAIKQWRMKQSLGRTWLRRPDLLLNQRLTTEQQILLNEFIKERN